MRIYISRHGQVSDTEFVGGHMFPAGDKPLSELGREQARLLGEYMLTLGFKGIILSSPYIRTMETAEIVAQILDCEIIPYAPIREIIKSEQTAKSFQGLRIEELRQRFPHVRSDAALTYPWWELKSESIEDVYTRVAECKTEINTVYSENDVLLIGHGASAGGLISAYGIPRWKSRLLCNCSLSIADTTDESFKPIYADTSFIPYEKCTSNFLTREEFDKEFFSKPYTDEIEIEKEATELQGKVLLHISDTPSRLYPYYERLISKVKPDIILHTGDMVDEVKVGRQPDARYEYLTKIKVILDIMKKSGASKLIIVPGNNDLSDALPTLISEAEIYESGSVIKIEGEECQVGHSVYSMTFENKWSFYGHGSRGDNWSFEQNDPNVKCRFNACGRSYVISLSEKKFYKIPQANLV